MHHHQKEIRQPHQSVRLDYTQHDLQTSFLKRLIYSLTVLEGEAYQNPKSSNVGLFPGVIFAFVATDLLPCPPFR